MLLIALKVLVAWLCFVVATVNMFSESYKYAKSITDPSFKSDFPSLNTTIKLFVMGIAYSVWYAILFN